MKPIKSLCIVKFLYRAMSYNIASVLLIIALEKKLID